MTEFCHKRKNIVLKIMVLEISENKDQEKITQSPRDNEKRSERSTTSLQGQMSSSQTSKAK